MRHTNNEQERKYCQQAWQKFWDDEELSFEDFLLRERAKLRTKYLDKLRQAKQKTKTR